MIIVMELSAKISVGTERIIREAKGNRGEEKSYKRYVKEIRKKIYEVDRNNSEKEGMYQKTKNMLKRARYNKESAVFWYVVFQFVIPLVLSVITAIHRNFSSSVAVFFMLFINTFYLVYKKGRRVAKQLEQSVYRIYKYLHNQVSAGVKNTDAIKSVYEVIDDKELKDILTRFTARYELTLDIDESLKYFCSYFNTLESETLAVAIKQGVDTGNNKDILMRQEEVMFNKYLNYIQLETENAKKKAAWSMVFFMIIIIIMIAVPMAQDMQDALNQIFIN